MGTVGQGRSWMHEMCRLQYLSLRSADELVIERMTTRSAAASRRWLCSPRLIRPGIGADACSSAARLLSSEARERKKSLPDLLAACSIHHRNGRRRAKRSRRAAQFDPARQWTSVVRLPAPSPHQTHSTRIPPSQRTLIDFAKHVRLGTDEPQCGVQPWTHLVLHACSTNSSRTIDDDEPGDQWREFNTTTWAAEFPFVIESRTATAPGSRADDTWPGGRSAGSETQSQVHAHKPRRRAKEWREAIIGVEKRPVTPPAMAPARRSLLGRFHPKIIARCQSLGVKG